jgi:hypothetical protein
MSFLDFILSFLEIILSYSAIIHEPRKQNGELRYPHGRVPPQVLRENIEKDNQFKVQTTYNFEG